VVGLLACGRAQVGPQRKVGMINGIRSKDFSTKKKHTSSLRDFREISYTLVGHPGIRVMHCCVAVWHLNTKLQSPGQSALNKVEQRDERGYLASLAQTSSYKCILVLVYNILTCTSSAQKIRKLLFSFHLRLSDAMM
jgi:hypothetical protein